VIGLSFLGAEFLTWLCFEPSDDISMGKRVSLKPLEGDERKVVIICPNLDDSGEFLQAIRSGYYVENAAFVWTQEERTHTFTLNSDGSCSGVKTEGSEKTTGESIEADILLRMSTLDEVEMLIRQKFAKFLELRLGTNFVTQEIQAIRDSVLGGLTSKLKPMQA
jgi:hypothetical protein